MSFVSVSRRELSRLRTSSRRRGSKSPALRNTKKAKVWKWATSSSFMRPSISGTEPAPLPPTKSADLPFRIEVADLQTLRLAAERYSGLLSREQHCRQEGQPVHLSSLTAFPNIPWERLRNDCDPSSVRRRSMRSLGLCYERRMRFFNTAGPCEPDRCSWLT